MGTSIQRYELTADDFGGQTLEGCNDYLVITRPDVIDEIHASFMEAGCDVLETDTFCSNRLTLREYALQDRVREINVAATRLARGCGPRSWRAPGCGKCPECTNEEPRSNHVRPTWPATRCNSRACRLSSIREPDSSAGDGTPFDADDPWRAGCRAAASSDPLPLDGRAPGAPSAPGARRCRTRQAFFYA
ncbi:MAG TPA: homocysteine S-methyltransferase family protein [Longimicrobium sp.]|nr:homocysteine S-methyltransferase family protein [Longimicrobium sp.]